MNMELIKAEVSKNKIAESIFYVLAMRMRNRKNTNLKFFKRVLQKNGVNINQEQINTVFKFLELNKIGRFTKNNRYFEWFRPLKALSHEVLDVKNYEKETRNRKKGVSVSRVLKTAEVSETNVLSSNLVVIIPLVGGSTFNLSIPKSTPLKILKKIQKTIDKNL